MQWEQLVFTPMDFSASLGMATAQRPWLENSSISMKLNLSLSVRNPN